jgi:AhpD family alkylhydroperoxidase
VLSLGYKEDYLMSALSELPIEEWDPNLRKLMEGQSNVSSMEKRSRSMTAHAPNMRLANNAFMEAAMNGRKISRRLLELVRLRVAFHNQCRTCMAIRFQSALDDGLTEDMVCSLEKPMDAPNLSDAEKAALEYADLFATNHFAITEANYAKLRKYFSEQEIVELGLFTGYFLGFGRFLATVNIVETLPESYQDKSRKVAPWESSETVVVDDTDPRNM